MRPPLCVWARNRSMASTTFLVHPTSPPKSLFTFPSHFSEESNWLKKKGKYSSDFARGEEEKKMTRRAENAVSSRRVVRGSPASRWGTHTSRGKKKRKINNKMISFRVVFFTSRRSMCWRGQHAPSFHAAILKRIPKNPKESLRISKKTYELKKNP